MDSPLSKKRKRRVSGTKKKENKKPSPDRLTAQPEKVAEVVMPAPDLDSRKPTLSIPEFMELLQKKGRGVEEPEYDASLTISELGFTYLIKKYGTRCFIVKEKNEIGEIRIFLHDRYPTIQAPIDLAEQLMQCIARGTELIFLNLLIVNDKEGHANLLIYRPLKKVIERFEPHGAIYFDDGELNFQIHTLLKDYFKNLDGLGEYKPTFRFAHEICPNTRGLQSIDDEFPRKETEAGYCQMWSLFLMETTMLNPTLNTGDIIQACLTHGKSDPGYFRNLIRGYTLQLGEEVHEAYRSFLGDDFKFATQQKDLHKYYRNRLSWRSMVQELANSTTEEQPFLSYSQFSKLIEVTESIKSCEYLKRYIVFLKNNRELKDTKLVDEQEVARFRKKQKELIGLMVSKRKTFKQLDREMLIEFLKMKNPHLIAYMYHSTTYPPKFLEEKLDALPFLDINTFLRCFGAIDVFPEFFKKCCDAFLKGWVPPKTKVSLAEVEKNAIANPESSDYALSLIFDFSAFAFEMWTTEQKNEILHGKLSKYQMTVKDMNSYVQFIRQRWS